MINLLPPFQKQTAKREYHFRLGAAYILLLSISIVIGVVLLLPSYFFANTKDSIAKQELEALQISSESTEREAINKELLETKERLQELTKEDTREPLFSVIDIVAANSGAAVNITNVSYVRAKSKEAASITVGGRAETRDSLLAFKQGLESEEFFNEVVLPVSSLASDENIQFNIEIKGSF